MKTIEAKIAIKNLDQYSELLQQLKKLVKEINEIDLTAVNR